MQIKNNTNIKRSLFLSLAVVLLLLSFLTVGCENKDIDTTKSIQIYARENPKDPNNLTRVRIGTVTVDATGQLTLAVEKEIFPASDNLRKAVAEIQSRKNLTLIGEVPEVIDGKNVIAFKEFAILPGDPLYIDAVADTLIWDYKLDAHIFKGKEQTESTTNAPDKGKIVVGFVKNVSQADAEQLLTDYGLEYIRTNDVNMGKEFFYETGEKFIVLVPLGEEDIWLERLRTEKDIKAVGQYIDPNKVLID